MNVCKFQTCSVKSTAHKRKHSSLVFKTPYYTEKHCLELSSFLIIMFLCHFSPNLFYHSFHNFIHGFFHQIYFLIFHPNLVLQLFFRFVVYICQQFMHTVWASTTTHIDGHKSFWNGVWYHGLTSLSCNSNLIFVIQHFLMFHLFLLFQLL